jgi:hypothetical protein
MTGIHSNSLGLIPEHQSRKRKQIRMTGSFWPKRKSLWSLSGYFTQAFARMPFWQWGEQQNLKRNRISSVDFRFSRRSEFHFICDRLNMQETYAVMDSGLIARERSVFPRPDNFCVVLTCLPVDRLLKCREIIPGSNAPELQWHSSNQWIWNAELLIGLPSGAEGSKKLLMPDVVTVHSEKCGRIASILSYPSPARWFLDLLPPKSKIVRGILLILRGSVEDIMISIVPTL